MYSAITIPRKTGSLYESLVLKWLSGMDKGTLYLTLPSGESVLLGDGNKNLSAQIHIRDEGFYKRCLLYGDIGFGEAYVDGLWDTPDITRVIEWALFNIQNTPSISGGKSRISALNLLKIVNRISHSRRTNSRRGSRKNISEHYDLNNKFFSLFLDPTMTYSAAWFRDEGMTLEEAQIAKYDRLARQLHLRPTDHVLEIGTGWGANAVYMASRYGCRVTTLTLSEEQSKLARERVAAAGLQDKVDVRLQDYREIEGTFDKIVSIEMLEAVGHAFLDTYFKKVHQLLKEDGILAVQVITCPDSRYDHLRKGVDWIQKHIFPGSLLPSIGALNRAINRTGDLTLVDCKDLGLDYARTLKSWYERFNNALSGVRELGFDECFIRQWNYYLCYCEAAFTMRNINVMHLVYTRPNNTGR
jgi:cyclopropane-fatty-acyl-phospholipid synthase